MPGYDMVKIFVIAVSIISAAIIAWQWSVVHSASSLSSSSSDAGEATISTPFVAPPLPDGVIKSFARVFDNALPDYMINNFYTEILRTDEFVRKAESLKGIIHNKKKTYFMPFCNYLGDRPQIALPRNYIELAILYLANFVTKSNLYELNPGSGRIIGAEWWVQYKEPREPIGFHYDKDEGTASVEMKMVFPAMSSVYYFDDVEDSGTRGHMRPTLVFNQTTKDGNTDKPLIPEVAFMVFPRKNRYFTFKGDLQHGVFELKQKPSASEAGKYSSSNNNKKRLTFLVNFWYQTPLEPYCVQLSPDKLGSMGLYSKDNIEQDFYQGKVGSRKIDDYVKIIDQLNKKAHLFSNCALDSGQSKLSETSKDRSNSFFDESIFSSNARNLERNFESLDIPLDSKQLAEYEVEIPPGEMLRFYLPNTMNEIVAMRGGKGTRLIISSSSTSSSLSSSSAVAADVGVDGSSENVQLSTPEVDSSIKRVDSSIKRDVFLIKWSHNQSFGTLGLLNLMQPNQVTHLFHLKEPKAFFIYDEKQDQDGKLVGKLKNELFPLARRYSGVVKLYYCPVSTCRDVLNVFGVLNLQPHYHLIDDNHNIFSREVNQNKYVDTSFSLSKDVNITKHIIEFWGSIGIGI